MKMYRTTFSFLLGLVILLTAQLSSAATVAYSSAAGSGTISDVANGYLYMSTDGSFTSGTGPDNTYLIEDAIPNAVDGAQLQTALTAIGSSFTVTDFTSSGGNTYPGLTSTGTSGTFTANNFSFQGFLVKAGNVSLVGLFNNPISYLEWNTLFAPNGSGKGYNSMSHIAFFNVSEVPVPAAMWLFAPALLGLFGLRRKHKTV